MMIIIIIIVRPHCCALHKMWTIVTNVLLCACVSVCACLQFAAVSPKMAEPIDVPLLRYDLGWTKEPCIRCGPRSPKGRGNFFGGGASSGPLWSIGNIWHEPNLFGRWQQQCSLLLSVLQQLVLCRHCCSLIVAPLTCRFDICICCRLGLFWCLYLAGSRSANLITASQLCSSLSLVKTLQLAYFIDICVRSGVAR